MLIKLFFLFSLQYISTILCLHSFSEAVLLFALPLLWLICHFHELVPPSFLFTRINLNFNLCTYAQVLYNSKKTMSIYLLSHITCFTLFELYFFHFYTFFNLHIQYLVVAVESMHNFIHQLWISPTFIDFTYQIFNYCLWITIFVIIVVVL